MDRYLFDEAMKKYEEEQFEFDVGISDIEPGFLITYPTKTGVRTFPIANICYSDTYPNCIEADCLTSYPEGREEFSGIESIDQLTSHRTFSISKIIKVGP